VLLLILDVILLLLLVYFLILGDSQFGIYWTSKVFVWLIDFYLILLKNSELLSIWDYEWSLVSVVRVY
jgi:hypothetical protein